MPTVLLIDDDDAIRGLLRTALEGVGYVVSEAANGIEGFQSFRQSPTDLVVTDIYMPGCDGLEVIQTLRRINPGIKILAVTGRSDIADFLEVARMLGASSVLRKPFEMGVFLQTVEDLLSGGTPNPTITDSES
jgi:CheY-like chemotaxis protein